MAHLLPAGLRRRVEFSEAGRDDEVARTPERVEPRQTSESGLAAHPVEPREHAAPHIELAMDEGMDEHRRRRAEPRGACERGGKHRVDHGDVRLLFGDDLARTSSSTAGEVR